jgi:hypothetical protein
LTERATDRGNVSTATNRLRSRNRIDAAKRHDAAMSRILTSLLAAALVAISAAAAAADGFGVCIAPVEGSAGTVESVREVPAARDLHAFDPAIFEHSVRPESAEELIVRLDTGPLVVFSAKQARRLSAGQRVRVHLDGSLVRVERELSC